MVFFLRLFLSMASSFGSHFNGSLPLFFPCPATSKFAYSFNSFRFFPSHFFASHFYGSLPITLPCQSLPRFFIPFLLLTSHSLTNRSFRLLLSRLVMSVFLRFAVTFTSPQPSRYLFDYFTLTISLFTCGGNMLWFDSFNFYVCLFC